MAQQYNYPTSNIRYGSPISPVNSAFNSSLVDSFFIKGGLKSIQSINDITDENNTNSWIPAQRRQIGSIIYDSTNGKYYKDTIGWDGDEGNLDSSSGYEQLSVLNGDMTGDSSTFSAGILVSGGNIIYASDLNANPEFNLTDYRDGPAGDMQLFGNLILNTKGYTVGTYDPEKNMNEYFFSVDNGGNTIVETIKTSKTSTSKIGNFAIYGDYMQCDVSGNSVITLDSTYEINKFHLNPYNVLTIKNDNPILKINEDNRNFTIQSSISNNKVGILLSNSQSSADVRFGIDSNTQSSIKLNNNFIISSSNTVNIPGNLLLGTTIGLSGFQFNNNILQISDYDEPIITINGDQAYGRFTNATSSTIRGSNYILGQSNETGSLNDNRIYFEGGKLYVQTISSSNYQGIQQTNLGNYKFNTNALRFDPNGASDPSSVDIIDYNVSDGILFTTDTLTASTKIIANSIQFSSIQNVDTSFSVDDSGNLECTSLKQTSLREYKHSILQIKNSELENIMKLRPVTFLYNGEQEQNESDLKVRQAGFIAQEMEEVYPQVVWYKNGILGGIQYQRLTSYLTKGIQQLIEQNTTQKEKINSLEQRIQKLERLISNGVM